MFCFKGRVVNLATPQIYKGVYYMSSTVEDSLPNSVQAAHISYANEFNNTKARKANV